MRATIALGDASEALATPALCPLGQGMGDSMTKRASNSTPISNSHKAAMRLRFTPIPDRVSMWSVWLVDQTDRPIGVIRLTEGGLFECRHRGQPQDRTTKGFPRRSDAARYLLITGNCARPIGESGKRATPASCNAVRRAA